jgi:hypothetical protein
MKLANSGILNVFTSLLSNLVACDKQTEMSSATLATIPLGANSTASRQSQIRGAVIEELIVVVMFFCKCSHVAYHQQQYSLIRLLFQNEAYVHRNPLYQKIFFQFFPSAMQTFNPKQLQQLNPSQQLMRMQLNPQQFTFLSNEEREYLFSLAAE